LRSKIPSWNIKTPPERDETLPGRAKKSPGKGKTYLWSLIFSLEMVRICGKGIL